MKQISIILGVIIVIGVLGVVAYRLFRPRDGGFGGFRDWVKNPDYKQAAADYFAARNALEVPADISDDEIQQMVDRLFEQEDEDFNIDRLKLVGSKAVPMLIAAIEKPETATMRFGEGGHALDAKSPFERIVDLLEPFGPADAARPLASFVEHEDEHFRKYAAIALGGIGTSECIAPMLKALEDKDVGYGQILWTPSHDQAALTTSPSTNFTPRISSLIKA